MDIALSANESMYVTVEAGERISFRILNADGSVKTEVTDKTVPAGKKFDGVFSYSGSITNV